LTCGNVEKAFLTDTATGKLVQSYRHGRGIRGAVLAPDDSRVLTWGEDGTLKLWDTKTGEELHILKNPAALRGALFGPDGKHILTWDADYTARWWDPSRPEALHKFEHNRELFGARLDAKGKQVLTWGLDRAAKIWDLDSGKLVRSLTHPGPVFGAAFAAEEGRVWTWSSDGFRLWDVKGGKELRHLPVEGGVPAAEPGRDDKHFLVQDGTGLVRWWDMATNKPLATFSQVFNVYGYYEALKAGILSPDQSRAVTWAKDGSVVLWDLASGLKLKTYPAGTVRGAAFTRDGTRVLTWNPNGTASLWDASFPRLLPPDEQLLALEVRTGVRVDEHGKLVGLSFEEWQDRRKKLEAVLPKKDD
jgi:WD40 repeat protein